jgi:hypothetical protein
VKIEIEAQNICHLSLYFKLPDYSCEEVLKERLMAATMEKGFHLN